MQKDCRNNPCQRFGSKLNLNLHLHVLALDGAYSFKHGKARFHRAGGLRPEGLNALLTLVITRVTRAPVCGWPKMSNHTLTCSWTHPTSSWLALQYAMSSPLALKPAAPRCACMTRCWRLGQPGLTQSHLPQPVMDSP